MIEKKQRFPEFYIKLMLIVCLLIVYFIINMQSNIVSLLFSISFIILIILFFRLYFIYGINKTETIDLFLLYSIIMIAFAATIDSTMSFVYLKKYILFCSTLIFLLIINKIEIGKKTVNFIFIINALIAIIYIYYVYYVKIYYTHIGLTLNFSNPNLTGIWIYHTILFLILATIFYKNKLLKLIYFVGSISLVYPMILTRSRTVLVSLICFSLLALFIWIRRNVKISKYFVVFILLTPLLSGGIYLKLLDSRKIAIFDFLVSEGKSIESREAVWLNAFSQLKSNLFLGTYHEVTQQMHNTHIDILVSYGVIVFVLTMVFIARILLKISKQSNSKFNTISLIAFLSVIILGTFEAALFSGGTGLYILSISLLLLAKLKKESESESSYNTDD